MGQARNDIFLLNFNKYFVVFLNFVVSLPPKITYMEKTIKISEKKMPLNIKTKPKRKSKWTLFREKYPNGIVTILDEEAVLQ